MDFEMGLKRLLNYWNFGRDTVIFVLVVCLLLLFGLAYSLVVALHHGLRYVSHTASCIYGLRLAFRNTFWIHGLSPCIHGLSPYIYGLSPCIQGLSPCIHGLSHASTDCAMHPRTAPMVIQSWTPSGFVWCSKTIINANAVISFIWG